MAALMGWVIASAIFVAILGQNIFDKVLGDVAPCEKRCENDTNIQNKLSVDFNNACDRGCRFYTIGDYMSEGLQPDHDVLTDNGLVPSIDPNPNTTTSVVKKICYESCVEAYSETSALTMACNTGCDYQQHIKEETKNKDDENTQTLHLMSPLFQIRSLYSKIVGSFHIVRISLVTYFLRDDNNIVAIESDPQVIMKLIPEGLRDLDNEGFVPMDPNGLEPMEGDLEARQLNLDGSEGVSDPYLVKCFSSKVGIPPYLLVASVAALILFTIYVIFAICSTSSRHKKYEEGLSVQSDALPLPVKLVRPEDLTTLSLMDDNEEAPPLPTKFKLPDSMI